eukprot:CAMPEP_0178421802 /NCGR_PEP_ID=MMETSP0689_2-20121128/26837_1 /TAXON_ID=160604 /ORGANISM="Amphidinium massartii, Strain CS-259" /LENGTH=638 /DNA_ID=CAMNT_0020043329 /DNA_START=54 /DNA_END=1970 /DNA_ORIENTATION=+
MMMDSNQEAIWRGGLAPNMQNSMPRFHASDLDAMAPNFAAAPWQSPQLAEKPAFGGADFCRLGGLRGLNDGLRFPPNRVDLNEESLDMFPPLQDARTSVREPHIDDSMYLLRTWSTCAEQAGDLDILNRKRNEWETFTSSIGGEDLDAQQAVDDLVGAEESTQARRNAPGDVRRALRLSMKQEAKASAASATAASSRLGGAPSGSQSQPCGSASAYDPCWLPDNDSAWCRRLQHQSQSSLDAQGPSMQPILSGVEATSLDSKVPGGGVSKPWWPSSQDSQPAFIPWGGTSSAPPLSLTSTQPVGCNRPPHQASSLAGEGSRAQNLSTSPPGPGSDIYGLAGSLLAHAAQLSQLNHGGAPTSLLSDPVISEADKSESPSPRRVAGQGKPVAKAKAAAAQSAPGTSMGNQQLTTPTAAPLSPTRPPKSMDTMVHRTLMVRNIPMRYTQDMLLVEWPPQGSFDFLYLPICIDKKRNASFAFVNFVSLEAAQAFYKRWHKQRLEHYSARKPLDISPADVQGREENLLQIMRNKTFRIRNAHFQPAIFEGDERVSMEAFFERRGVEMPKGNLSKVASLPASGNAPQARQKTNGGSEKYEQPNHALKAAMNLQPTAGLGDLSRAGFPMFDMDPRVASMIQYGTV